MGLGLWDLKPWMAFLKSREWDAAPSQPAVKPPPEADGWAQQMTVNSTDSAWEAGRVGEVPVAAA